MIVLEKELSNVYSEIDLVATPQGAPADQEKRTRENMERMRRMLDQMKKEG